jgi:hypothetical protein
MRDIDSPYPAPGSRYDGSEKGRDRHTRYNRTEAGRARWRNYARRNRARYLVEDALGRRYYVNGNGKIVP